MLQFVPGSLREPNFYVLYSDLQKIIQKIRWHQSGESREQRAYHNNSDTHDNPPFTVVMLVNILFSED
jgi:hypothetical protein